MSKWIGYAVSVNCGEPLGCYQGTILEADGSTITLNKAFRNGFPYPKLQVTLNAADIKELKIIESKPEPPEQTHSTVTVTKSNKKGARATVCESLQANPSSSGNQPCQNASNGTKGNRSQGTNVDRSKPIDIQNNRNNSHNTNMQPGSYGNTGSTPKVRHNSHSAMRRRDEACFGDGAEPAVQEFDFEGNLALFDKQALWEQMSSRPDVVLPAARAPPAALQLPPAALQLPPGAARAGGGGYLTEGGLRVPAACPAARAQLWRGLAALGAARDARLLQARAAADVCLRLLGGWRRLETGAGPRAAAVALVAPRAPGAAGLQALRLLAEHTVAVHLHQAGAGPASPEVCRELALLAQCGARPQPLGALPAADVVIIALNDPLDPDPQDHLYTAALEWASRSRGSVVVLEPGEAAGAPPAPPLAPRAALCALWPGAAGGAPRLYLTGAGAPPQLYRSLRMPQPPAAASGVLPLYPDN